jgi:hypothetical protein
MSDIANCEPKVNFDERPAFAWGAEQIGRVLDRTPRQAHHLLTTGRIKCALKVGGKWCASRSALLREFGAR